MFGTKFLFDHHDINPELYEAKFGRRDFFYGVMLRWEKLTFQMADVSIATNESYRKIAIDRGEIEALMRKAERAPGPASAGSALG